MKDNIQHKRGKLIISFELLNQDGDGSLLKKIYSNFFPVDVIDKDSKQLTLLCVSNYFKELKDFDVIPTYIPTFKLVKNEIVIDSISIE